MDAERWRKIEQLYHAALESEPSDRARFMEQACEGDEALRAEVESLLAEEERTANFLGSPALQVLAKEWAKELAAPVSHPEPEWLDGQTISHYRIMKKLGAGGFGVVYQVYDNDRDAVVALKALRGAAGGALYDFKREFRGLANTVHPNLVMLYELLSDNQQWFFTMEFVEGVDFLRYVRNDDPPGTLPQSHICSGNSMNSSPPWVSQPWPGSRDARAPVPSIVPPFRERPLNLDRLRPALRQLAEGVCALHQAGKLHRDLKPSNVLVTKDGRVVILDFGLTTEIAPEAGSESAGIIGTPAYMSPEQAAGKPLSEASDWYSVGVMLHEALTGRLPFVADTLDVLALKQDTDIPPPSTLAVGLPADLNSLCRDLLGRDASSRPSGREVIERLGGANASALAATPASLTAEPPFVGRERELGELQCTFEVARAGRAAVAYVHGGSGIGKSALVGHFLKELRARDAAVVLAGRCYERESVPYKAIDSLVDALTQHLKALPRSQGELLVPANASALARLFPVLERIESFAAGGERTGETPDLLELRQRGFAAFRELLTSLARRKPLVLFIDDAQWGDADSAALLAGLLRPPEPPPVMWIICYRSEEAGTSPLLRTLRPSEFESDSQLYLARVAVKELTLGDARDLASQLLGRDAQPDAVRAEVIAREAGGNPFFIHELAHYRGEAAEAKTSLNNIIESRVSRLPGAARLVLELVAVAGQPIALDVVKQAARIQGEEQAVLGILRASHLIRTRMAEGRNEIEAYHDRTRESVGARLSPQLLKGRHWALASALEASGQADPEMLLTHFQGAGDSDKARVYAVAAAERAFTALAFERAAGLYRVALDLGPGEAIEAGRLHEKLGDALTNAGRGEEAAQAYLSATEGMTGLAKLELERRAAAQLLLSGRIEEGLTVARGVLEAVGVKLARTLHRSPLRYLFWRARIRLRGMSFHERAASEVSAAERIRIDTCFSLLQGLAMVDTFWAHEFHARNLLYSLRSGDIYRIARALISETSVYALPGGPSRRRAAKLLELATSLAARSGNPHGIAVATLESGVCAFAQGQWAECRRRMDLAAATLRQSCTGVAWEIATSHLMGSVSLFFLGELKLLNERLPGLLEEAETRGDLYQGTDLRSRLAHIACLSADEPEKAYGEIKMALARWPRQHYHLQHWWALIARLEVDFYCGRGCAAWEQITMQWRPLLRSQQMRVQYVRILSLHHRARAALAAAEGPSILKGECNRLIKTAERHAAVIQREKMPWGSGLALLIRAGVAARRGNHGEAVRLLRDAEEMLEFADMKLYAAAGRRRRGELTAGDEGRALIAAADAQMRDQRILNPVRMADMLAPRI